MAQTKRTANTGRLTAAQTSATQIVYGEDGIPYSAYGTDDYRPSYVGASPLTVYQEYRNGSWHTVAWNAIPSGAYRKLRALVRARSALAATGDK
jgi:hypothetical protein